MKTSEVIGDQLSAIEKQVAVLWGWSSMDRTRRLEALDSLERLVGCLKIRFREHHEAQNRRKGSLPGKTQVAFLCCVVEHGSFSWSGGWLWSNRSTSKRLLTSLEQRGLVKAEMRATGNERHPLKAYWVATDAGKALVDMFQKAKRAAREERVRLRVSC